MAIATSTDTPYVTQISADGFNFTADTESRGKGGSEGMRPHALLDSSLAACIAMTVRIAADVRQTRLETVTAEVTHEVFDGVTVFRCTLELAGDLSEKERAGLTRVARHCPISKMLVGAVEIQIDS